MAFKINISTKEGKTYKIEAEAPGLKQKKLGDIIKGEDISENLKGYELEITGASDKAGFTALKGIPGIGLKKVLLGYGKAMHKRPKGDKKVNKKPKGLRLRKTVRGEVISDAIVQINTKVVKQGPKTLAEIFPEQNKTPVEKPEAEELANPEKEPKENVSAEEDKAHPDEEPKPSKEELKELANPDKEPSE